VPGVLPVSIQKGPTPPIESKPDVATALAPPTVSSAQVPVSLGKLATTGPKSGHIMPAVPLSSPKIKPATSKGPLQASSGNTVQTSTNAGLQSDPSHPSQTAAASLQDATRAATAAVAAAMAKLPPAPSQKRQPADGIEHLTKKVDEMRTHEHIRHSRQPGTGGYAAGNRGGGRGGYRGGRHHEQTKKVEVPTTDYDFQSANAKFNKQDLVKEAIASGSPVGTPGEAPATNGSSDASVNGRKGSEHSLVTPSAGGSYNKTTSFFDNISSESKDRDDANAPKPGGREWRGEEQKKNLETFGASSVDNGYRGGFRGRGRGRGFGRGRGGGGVYAGGAQGARSRTGTGRGGFRGGRSGPITTET
jgi:protein LSM14